MNKAFELILERLRNLAENYGRLQFGFNDSCEIQKYVGMEQAVDLAIEIVQEVAEEYNGGWISVKDRLPDKAGSYLVIGKSGGATVTRWYMPSKYSPKGHFGGNSKKYIRYWMPRPEPPKERD